MRYVYSIDYKYPPELKIEMLTRLASQGMKFHSLPPNSFGTSLVPEQSQSMNTKTMKEVVVKLRRLGTIYRDLSEADADVSVI